MLRLSNRGGNISELSIFPAVKKKKKNHINVRGGVLL
jgi:hypothetical protein